MRPLQGRVTRRDEIAPFLSITTRIAGGACHRRVSMGCRLWARIVRALTTTCTASCSGAGVNAGCIEGLPKTPYGCGAKRQAPGPLREFEGSALNLNISSSLLLSPLSPQTSGQRICAAHFLYKAEKPVTLPGHGRAGAVHERQTLPRRFPLFTIICGRRAFVRCPFFAGMRKNCKKVFNFPTKCDIIIISMCIAIYAHKRR